MKKVVEFYYDVVSPYTYLAATQIDKLEPHAEVKWVPFLLGGVFKLAGNVMPAANPAKGNYMWQDLQNMASYFGVPMQMPKQFPINSLQAMRALCALEGQAQKDAALALFNAFWVEGKDISDVVVLTEILGSEVVARASDEQVKNILKANTEAAASRGAFGAPTFFLGDEMFFGCDRLVVIEHKLKQG